MSGTPIEKRIKAVNKILEEYNQINNTAYQFDRLELADV